jgi:hypothetical protein
MEAAAVAGQEPLVVRHMAEVIIQMGAQAVRVLRQVFQVHP